MKSKTTFRQIQAEYEPIRVESLTQEMEWREPEQAASTPAVRPSSEPRTPEPVRPELASSVQGGPSDSMPFMAPMAHDTEISLDELGNALPEGLLADVGRAVHDTEKTRLVVKAITQLLVEKQILSLDEIQSRIGQFRSGDARG